MAKTTVQHTAWTPRLALGVVLERTRPGRASIADVAVALNVLTAVINHMRVRWAEVALDDADFAPIDPFWREDMAHGV